MKKLIFFLFLLTSSLLYGQTTVEKDIFGNTIYKDEHGSVIEVHKKDIFNNTVIEDGHGRTIRTIKKDIFGNTIVEDERGITEYKIEKDISVYNASAGVYIIQLEVDNKSLYKKLIIE